ncbi:MAG: tetratricopeptide repeat protein [Planctomycetota bacterium]|jgi:TolA-binding protein
MRRPLASVLTLLALVAAGCSSGSNPSGASSRSRGSALVIPSSPAGDAAARGEPGSGREAEVEELSPEETASRLASRQREAQALWERAVAIEERNPSDAADLFQDVVEDYPEYENAAEARFRQGKSEFRAGAYDEAPFTLADYMSITPVNPHLAEVEEMIFESGTRYLDADKGFLGIFRTDDPGLDALKYVAETFPAGTYADDALLILGDYYREDDDYAAAVLHYKELLIRYPDSEWSFQARLRMADTYLDRDKGDPYHAGFVDVDPRERVLGPDGTPLGPVKSGPTMAEEQYDAYLERLAADPGRSMEYTEQIAYARRQRAATRERLSAKELSIANWYAGRGEMAAARVYYESAASRADTPSGRAAAQRLRAMPAPRPTPRPVRTPSPTTRPVTPPPAPAPSAVPPPAPSPPPAPAPAPTTVPPSPPRVAPPTTPPTAPGGLPPPVVRPGPATSSR